MNENFKLKIREKDLEINIKDWTAQTSGSCLVRYGDTELLVTAVMASEEKENLSFFPLTVDYEEKYYAAREIYGSRFVRRETRPTDQAVLTARMIDRAIRPLFPKNIRRELQIIATCLSFDGENDPDTLGAIGTSLALSISDIPWDGPIAMVKVGKIEGKWIVNPTYSEKEESELDLVLSGVEENNQVLINMIELEGEEVAESDVLEGIKFAKPYLKQLIDFQKEIQKKIGKEKIALPELSEPDIEKETKKFLKGKLEKALFGKDSLKTKGELAALNKELIGFIEEKHPEEEKTKYALDYLEKEKERVLQESILKEEKRPDGRKLDELRPISCEVNVLAKTHGSGFFSRGLTKILSVTTLGGPGDYQILEGMEIVGKKRFLHHYNFPPYSVGEVARLRGPGRREIGHGYLAEKALRPVIPDFDEFPYTIRVVSEALSSNGSTSMGSACAASLALMDAGVPIKSAVAGIAIGLVQDNSGNYKILTDIQGPEDGFGGMDFKVAGSKKGITAIQLDVKVKGLTEQIIEESLARAKKARLEILEKMKEVIASPRPELPPSAPKIKTLQIDPEKIGEVIGPGGKIINKIIDEYNVEIDIEDSGLVYVTSQDQESCDRAVQRIKNIVKTAEVGEIYNGKVERIEDYGAFVEILPGKTGLLHISRIAPYHIRKVQDIIKVGDIVPVKVISIDDQGRINLSAIEAGFKPKKHP